MSILSIIVGFLLSFTVIAGIIGAISLVMSSGLFDQLVSGLLIIEDLFGSTWAYIFVALFTLGAMVLVIRFIMSWIGENPGHSANS